MYLWIKAVHVIFMVTWFAGLFYLPRLFVYHAMSDDEISHARFKIMERKLYYGITTPGAVLTIVFGFWLLSFNWDAYLHLNWLLLKLAFIIGLMGYHVYLGKLVYDFKRNNNKHGHVYYRWINEVPVLFLIAIVVLAVVKPF